MKISVSKTIGDEDVFVIGMDTENATAFDYLIFMRGVNELVMGDGDSLERSANLAGKTINHNLKNSIGSIPKDL